MSALIPLAAFITLLHAGIYMSSAHPRKLYKLIAAEILAVAGILCGISLLLVNSSPAVELALYIALIALPAISLLVYLPSWWKRH